MSGTGDRLRERGREVLSEVLSGGGWMRFDTSSMSRQSPTKHTQRLQFERRIVNGKFKSPLHFLSFQPAVLIPSTSLLSLPPLPSRQTNPNLSLPVKTPSFIRPAHLTLPLTRACHLRLAWRSSRVLGRTAYARRAWYVVRTHWRIRICICSCTLHRRIYDRVGWI